MKRTPLAVVMVLCLAAMGLVTKAERYSAGIGEPDHLQTIIAALSERGWRVATERTDGALGGVVISHAACPQPVRVAVLSPTHELGALLQVVAPDTVLIPQAGILGGGPRAASTEPTRSREREMIVAIGPAAAMDETLCADRILRRPN
ncbi:MAG: hypothetical protein ACFCUN_02095 [Hyphomicrobiaceae bacterium]